MRSLKDSCISRCTRSVPPNLEGTSIIIMMIVLPVLLFNLEARIPGQAPQMPFTLTAHHSRGHIPITDNVRNSHGEVSKPSS